MKIIHRLLTTLFFISLVMPGGQCPAASHENNGLDPANPVAQVVQTETIYRVMPARSLNNLFAGIVLPQNPGMADNNWNSGHQDSYNSDSVGLSGPTGVQLKLIQKENPYGFTGVMACNVNNQMIGNSFSFTDSKYRLIVFDHNLNIISATVTGNFVLNSFGGGYFYLNEDNNSVVIGDNKMKCYPTADVDDTGKVSSLEPLWVSDDIVTLVTESSDPNSLYASLPVWGQPNMYWCLLAGNYDFDSSAVISPAYIALVRIVPDERQSNGCTTSLIAKMELPGQWSNNTLAVDDQGAYFVTNGCSDGPCNTGYLYAVAFDSKKGRISPRWKYEYKNSGLLKTGMSNIGSGTSATIIENQRGLKRVVIADNAYPRLNVVVVDHKNGHLIAELPVFPEMRGCSEASPIGVGNSIVIENNFGHTNDPQIPQLEPNEPGLALIEMGTNNSRSRPKMVWENDQTSFFAMSQLARESGIIFASTGDWDDKIASEEGGMYYISAIDSWDGRIIWQVPLGRGQKYCHEYGGIYFDHDENLYVGTRSYLFSIQNYTSE